MVVRGNLEEGKLYLYILDVGIVTLRVRMGTYNTLATPILTRFYIYYYYYLSFSPQVYVYQLSSFYCYVFLFLFTVYFS